MGQYNIEDDYASRVRRIAHLLAMVGEDDTTAETEDVLNLMGVLGAFYQPDMSPTSEMTPAQRQLQRVFARVKDDARVACYYRDILKARMDQT